MTGGEEVKRKGVIHVSGVNRSSSLGSTHTHSVCASQHVFPIWFHPVPQHWLNADLFSLIFLLSHVLLFCSFFSSQSTSLPPLSLLSLSLSPAIPHVISLSPLTLISYPRLPLLFISVTQHLDLMLFLRCGFVLCVCVWQCDVIAPTFPSQIPQRCRHLPSLSFAACHSASCVAKDNRQPVI